MIVRTALVAAIAITSATFASTLHAETQTGEFACGRDYLVRVTLPIDESTSATIRSRDGQQIDLTRVPSPGAIAFREGSFTFHVPSDQAATLTAGETQVISCAPRGDPVQPASESFLGIRGEIILPGQFLVPDGAKIQVRIVRTGRSGKVILTLAELETTPEPGKQRQAFETLLDRSLLPADGQLAILARLNFAGRTIAQSKLADSRFRMGEDLAPPEIKLIPVRRR